MEGGGGGLSPDPTPQHVWWLLSTSVVGHMTTFGGVMRETLKTDATIQKLKHKHPDSSSQPYHYHGNNMSHRMPPASLPVSH